MNMQRLASVVRCYEQNGRAAPIDELIKQLWTGGMVEQAMDNENIRDTVINPYDAAYNWMETRNL